MDGAFKEHVERNTQIAARNSSDKIQGVSSDSDHNYSTEIQPFDAIRDDHETNSQRDTNQNWVDKAKSALQEDFYTFNSIGKVKLGDKKFGLLDAGKNMSTEGVRNNYHRSIEEIDKKWGVIQSLSQKKGGLTQTGEILTPYLQGQFGSTYILFGTHHKEKGEDESYKQLYKGALRENTRRFQDFSRILGQAPNSSPNAQGLREQMETVKSGTLGKRLEKAKKLIKSNWRRIPNDGSWHGENKEKLWVSITEIARCATLLKATKNMRGATERGGRFLTQSKEQELMLRSDVYKAVL